MDLRNETITYIQTQQNILKTKSLDPEYTHTVPGSRLFTGFAVMEKAMFIQSYNNDSYFFGPQAKSVDV